MCLVSAIVGCIYMQMIWSFCVPFSECNSSEFTCATWYPHCIPASRVCDGGNDCEDGSDELNYGERRVVVWESDKNPGLDRDQTHDYVVPLVIHAFFEISTFVAACCLPLCL